MASGSSSPPKSSVTTPSSDDQAAKEAAAKEKQSLQTKRGPYGSKSIATSPLGDTSTAPTSKPKLG